MKSFSSHSASSSQFHINIDGRIIPVVKAPRARRDVLVYVNTDTFDDAFKRDEGFYIGKNGVGGIHDRYKRFNMFIRGGMDDYIDKEIHPAESIEASEISVRDDGTVGFTNGRHRYAWMRDNGVKAIPVTMDKKSKRNAEKYNYIG